MSWSKKDIIADINKNKKLWEDAGYAPIDINLSYPELKRAYTQQIYSIAFHGSGSRDLGLIASHRPPPDTKDLG